MWQAVQIAPFLARRQPCTMLRYSLVVNILLDYEQSSFQSSITNSLIFILHNLILVNLASSSSSPSPSQSSSSPSSSFLHLHYPLPSLPFLFVKNIVVTTMSDIWSTEQWWTQWLPVHFIFYMHHLLGISWVPNSYNSCQMINEAIPFYPNAVLLDKSLVTGYNFILQILKKLENF